MAKPSAKAAKAAATPAKSSKPVKATKTTKGGPAPDVFAMMEADSKARLKRAPSEAESKHIAKLGIELAELEDEIEEAEERVKELKKRAWDIKTKELVDAMDEIQQDLMGLPDQNCDIRVYTKYHASLPAVPGDNDPEYKAKMAKRKRGLEFLKKDGHDGLIKTELVITFGRGEYQRAKQIEAEFKDRADEYARQHEGQRPFMVDTQETVNWNSLTSLVKDLSENHGRTDLPLADLGASVFRIAEIKKRKERKSKSK